MIIDNFNVTDFSQKIRNPEVGRGGASLPVALTATLMGMPAQPKVPAAEQLGLQGGGPSSSRCPEPKTTAILEF